MPTERIHVSRLKGISILYEGDLYELARWLVRCDVAQSTPTAIRRHTVHGLAGHYAYLTNMSLQDVRRLLARARLPLEATIEPDDEAA